MRTILVIPFVVSALLQSKANAQGYFPFPDSAALWVQTYSFMVVGPPFPEFEVQAVANIQVNGSDTIIADITYSQLTDLLTGAYYGGIRDDGGRVWHVPPDSVNAYILYDFTVSPGDTVHDVIYYQAFPGNWGGPHLVDLIVEDVYADPAWGGRLVVHAGAWPWIEGIGHAQGLLAEPDINVSGYQLRLECMSHLDTIRFEYYGEGELGIPGNCHPMALGVQDGLSNRSMRVFPNPSQGLFLLVAPVPWPLMVLDIHGCEVLRLPPHSREIDLTDRPPGVYTVIQQTPQGRSVQRLVMVK
jgi:hypothetical protein